MKKILITLGVGLFLVLVGACTEEIPLESNQEAQVDLSKLLVVEASISDEVKQQTILISRVAPLENDTLILKEVGADVFVTDDFGNRFDFEQNVQGDYVSQEPFAANSSSQYTLNITTKDGVSYVSDSETSAGISTINKVYAERIISQSGTEGVAIYVDSSSPQGTSGDFKYQWEETYKIIAPNWTGSEFEILTEGDPTISEFPNVRLVPRTQEEEVCFKSEVGKGFALADGAIQENNLRERNQVIFLNRENPKISHRYSLLVKQSLLSPSASRFYETLKNFSENESLFSAVQPGLIEGNIKSSNDDEALVIGFFEVTTTVLQRYYFNYQDLFPGENLPPYFDGLNCENFIAPTLLNPLRDGPIPPDVTCGFWLIDVIKNEQIEFFSDNSNPPPECQGPYIVTPRPCGDCTALGSNVKPDFWID